VATRCHIGRAAEEAVPSGSRSSKALGATMASAARSQARRTDRPGEQVDLPGARGDSYDAADRSEMDMIFMLSNLT
jgi:hypothetical protein